MEPKPIVSKRNHFDSAAEIVDAAFVPDELKHPNLSAWLLRYTEHVIQRVQHSFARAAERGIEQAAALICDPDFYEHRKESRKKALKQWRDREQEQEQERLQRKHWPTAEQIAQDIAWCDRELVYYHKQIEKYQAKLKELHAKLPAADLEKASRTGVQ